MTAIRISIAICYKYRNTLRTKHCKQQICISLTHRILSSVHRVWIIVNIRTVGILVTILNILCYPIEAGLVSLLVALAAGNQTACKSLDFIELLVGYVHVSESVGAECHIGIQQQARCDLWDCSCCLWRAVILGEIGTRNFKIVFLRRVSIYKLWIVVVAGSERQRCCNPSLPYSFVSSSHDVNKASDARIERNKVFFIVFLLVG